MKWLLTGLCIIAIATTPVAASANVEGEAKPAEPIVIAYIPEHLQHRVPGHQHKHQASAPSSKQTEPKSPEPWLRLELDSSGFEATSAAPFGYVAPSRESPQWSRRRALGFGIGLGLGIPLLIGAAVGAAMSLQSINQIGQ